MRARHRHSPTLKVVICEVIFAPIFGVTTSLPGCFLSLGLSEVSCQSNCVVSSLAMWHLQPLIYRWWNCCSFLWFSMEAITAHARYLADVCVCARVCVCVRARKGGNHSSIVLKLKPTATVFTEDSFVWNLRKSSLSHLTCTLSCSIFQYMVV